MKEPAENAHHSDRVTAVGLIVVRICICVGVIEQVSITATVTGVTRPFVSPIRAKKVILAPLCCVFTTMLYYFITVSVYLITDFILNPIVYNC